MAGTFKFHSKYHNSSHYTVSGYGYDGGSDPIASADLPFYGIFFNTLTDQQGTYNIATNSFEWYQAYATVKGLSSIWAPTDSLYQTVNSLSSNWNLGYNGYLTFASNSARLVSTYTTVTTLSSNWYNEYTMYTNRAQEYTAAKTFSGTNLTLTLAPSTIGWNVQNNQVTFFAASGNVFISNATNMKNGGTYVLVLSTGSRNVSAFFDSSYRLSNNLRYTRTVNLSGYSRTIFDFTSDGVLMYGNPTYYIE